MSEMPPFIAAQLKAADDAIDRALTLIGAAAGWCGVKHPHHVNTVCVRQPHDPTTYHLGIAPLLGDAQVEWRTTAYIHPPEVLSGEVDPDEQHDIAKEAADRWEPNGFDT